MNMKISRIHFLCNFFLLNFYIVFSQNKISSKDIYSANFASEKFDSTYSVIKKNNFITLSFDDLNLLDSDYYYQINHFNHVWEKSNLFKSDYIEGYDDNLITNYSNSFNTLVDYKNFRITIPNKNLKFKISGNYSISIHDDYGNFLFERKFSILEEKTKINIEFFKSKNLKNYNSHQNLDITVNCSNCNNLTRSSSQLKLVIIKNNQWSNKIVLNEPDFFFDNKLIYKNISYRGGNEFYYFDSSSINSTNLRIYKTELKDFYNSYLRKDIEKINDTYNYNPDINGKYLINRSIENYETENDYSRVFFSFKPIEVFDENKIFIVGDFNNYEISEKYQLKLENGIYYGNFLFKQGFYNYKYCSINSLGEFNLIEPSFWQTENNYTVLLYHKKNTDKYYSLIGFKEQKSDLIKN